MDWSEAAMTIITVLGSAGILTYISARRREKLDFITKERENWRKEIREIMERLQKAVSEEKADEMKNSAIRSESIETIPEVLVSLKARINTYGELYMKNGNVLKDSHIWTLIRLYERKEVIKDVSNWKQTLIEVLGLLLKYEWEKAKQEVEGDSKRSVLQGVIALGLILLVSPIYFLVKPEVINKKIEYFELIPIIAIVVGAIVILYWVISLLTKEWITNKIELIRKCLMKFVGFRFSAEIIGKFLIITVGILEIIATVLVYYFLREIIDEMKALGMKNVELASIGSGGIILAVILLMVKNIKIAENSITYTEIIQTKMKEFNERNEGVSMVLLCEEEGKVSKFIEVRDKKRTEITVYEEENEKRQCIVLK